MNFISLSYDAAHVYVDKTHGAFWDGWDIVVWKADPRAYKKRNGMFKFGQWGTAKRFIVGASGKWRLPTRP